MNPTHNTICAWCLVERGEKPRPGDSHGICPHHYQEVLRQAGAPENRIRESLLRLGAPQPAAQPA